MEEHNLRSFFFILPNVDFVLASVIGFGPRGKLQSCRMCRSQMIVKVRLALTAAKLLPGRVELAARIDACRGGSA